MNQFNQFFVSLMINKRNIHSRNNAVLFEHNETLCVEFLDEDSEDSEITADADNTELSDTGTQSDIDSDEEKQTVKKGTH